MLPETDVLVVGAGPTGLLAAGWAARVQVVSAGGRTDKLVLVRPDGYIAWAARHPDSGASAERIHAALAEWCGPPADEQTAEPQGTEA
jgi:threonine dehydrogenase-like Zn-dependent dehydrogenase